MKQKLLLLYIAFSFFACKPEPDRIPDKHNYNYLTAEQLAKTPYFTNPAFDTLTYVSNQNDTVVFAKTRVDSGWYREIDFNPGVEFTTYHYYQQISAKYQTIKGEGSFGVVHILRNYETTSEIIKVQFKGINFGINANWFDSSFGYNYYIGDTLINGNSYNQTIKVFANCDITSSTLVLNTVLGAIFINEVSSNTFWNLLKD